MSEVSRAERERGQHRGDSVTFERRIPRWQRGEVPGEGGSQHLLLRASPQVCACCRAQGEVVLLEIPNYKPAIISLTYPPRGFLCRREGLVKL